MQGFVLSNYVLVSVFGSIDYRPAITFVFVVRSTDITPERIISYGHRKYTLSKIGERLCP